MFENLPKAIKVVEVGPRDGLQNESNQIPTAGKVELINHLAKAGLSNIEISSFVSPKWIPQLKDALEVSQSLKLPDVVKSALVPNLKGYERFKEASLGEGEPEPKCRACSDLAFNFNLTPVSLEHLFCNR